MAAPSLHHLQSPPASLKLAASWSQILSEDMEAYHCPHAWLNHVGPPPAAGSNSLCPSPEPWVALKHPGVVGQHTHSSCRLATASLCQSFQPALASQHMASAQCHLPLAKQDRADCKETLPSHGGCPSLQGQVTASHHWRGMPPCARWHSGWCWKGVHSYGREWGSRAPCPPCREQKQAVTQHSLLGCRNGNRTGCACPVLLAWASQLWLSQCFLCLFGLLDNFESRSWKGWRLNSLFFPTSTCCCLKPQRLTGPSGKMLKPQPSCARSEMPCRESLCPLVLIPQHATEFPSSLSALAALRRALLSSPSTLLAAREGTRAVGLLLCRGLSPAPQAWHHGEGLLPPPGHAPGPAAGSGVLPGHPYGQGSRAAPGLQPAPSIAGCAGEGARVKHGWAARRHVLPLRSPYLPYM